MYIQFTLHRCIVQNRAYRFTSLLFTDSKEFISSCGPEPSVRSGTEKKKSARNRDQRFERISKDCFKRPYLLIP